MNEGVSSIWADIHGVLMNLECDNIISCRVHGNAPAVKLLWSAHSRMIKCEFDCERCKCTRGEYCEEVEMARTIIDAFQHGQLDQGVL